MPRSIRSIRPGIQRRKQKPARRRKMVATMDDTVIVTCPYCGEDVEIYLEPDLKGTVVQDCEVCCNPWRLRVSGRGQDRLVEVSRGDGSE